MLESLALCYAQTLAKLEDLTGQKIEVLHIVGGGTRNNLLNQLTADAVKRTVVTGPVEATAIGNVLIQALALGASNLATKALMWVPLMYLLPILTTLVGAWLLAAPTLPGRGKPPSAE